MVALRCGIRKKAAAAQPEASASASASASAVEGLPNGVAVTPLLPISASSSSAAAGSKLLKVSFGARPGPAPPLASLSDLRSSSAAKLVVADV